MKKISILLLSFMLFLGGCSQKSKFFNEDVVGESALMNTKKGELYNSLELKASLSATYLNNFVGEYKNDKGELLREWFFRNGLNIRPLGNAVYLMPPYCITDEQLTRAYDGIFEGLKEVLG